MSNTGIFKTLREYKKNGEPVVLATVVDTEGSTPAKKGAKMLVSETDLHGTVGGGAIEKAVIERSRELLGEEDSPDILDFDLSPDLEMCCGGKMKVFLEPFFAKTPLIVFGAGHIGENIALMGEKVGFDVTVCDTREKILENCAFEGEKVHQKSTENILDDITIRPETFATVVTHDHELDLDILRQILDRGSLPEYVGMIGSKRKWNKFIQRLNTEGYDSEMLEKIHTPIGLNIGGNSPEEIAVSVTAELIAVKHGREDDLSW